MPLAGGGLCCLCMGPAPSSVNGHRASVERKPVWSTVCIALLYQRENIVHSPSGECVLCWIYATWTTLMRALHLGMCAPIPDDCEFGQHLKNVNGGSARGENVDGVKIMLIANANAQILLDNYFATPKKFCLNSYFVYLRAVSFNNVLQKFTKLISFEQKSY